MSDANTGGTDTTGADGRSTETRRRRPPLWLLILAGALVIGLVVVAVFVFGDSDEPAEIPVAETVTLAAPTPTVDPIPREAGTAFFDSLPSTVLASSLTEAGEHAPLLADGALEGYRLAYSDGGGTDLTVLAGQWRDAASVQAAFDRVIAAQPAEEPGLEATRGEVDVDDAVVGAYLIVPRGDGTGTAWWTNGTVLIQVDGPAEALPDFYAAFPL